MSETTNLALTRIRTELPRQAPHPVEMLEFMGSLEEHTNPSNMEWQDLEEMDAVRTMGDVIIHLKGGLPPTSLPRGVSIPG